MPVRLRQEIQTLPRQVCLRPFAQSPNPNNLRGVFQNNLCRSAELGTIIPAVRPAGRNPAVPARASKANPTPTCSARACKPRRWRARTASSPRTGKTVARTWRSRTASRSPGLSGRCAAAIGIRIDPDLHAASAARNGRSAPSPGSLRSRARTSRVGRARSGFAGTCRARRAGGSGLRIFCSSRCRKTSY